MRDSRIITSLFILAPLSFTGSALPESSFRVLDQVENHTRVEHARELLGHGYEKSVVKESEQELDVHQFIFKQTQKALGNRWKSQAWRVSQTIIEEGRKHNMDPIFLMAVIRHESRFNPLARGRHGEIGLMQIRPNTAEWITAKLKIEWKGKYSLENMSSNIRIGTAYMSFLRKKFQSKGGLYMAAYNMGAANVRRALGRSISPREYASKVMRQYINLYSDLRNHAKDAEATNGLLALSQ